MAAVTKVNKFLFQNFHDFWQKHFSPFLGWIPPKLGSSAWPPPPLHPPLPHPAIKNVQLSIICHTWIQWIDNVVWHLTHQHTPHCHTQWRQNSHNLHNQHLGNKSAGQFSSLPKSIFHKYTKNWGGLTWVQHSIQTGWGRCWVAIAVGSTWALVVIWTWTLIEAWVWTTTESWTWPLVETRTLVESSTTRLTPGLIVIARPNLIMRSFAHTEMIFRNYCFGITCAPAPWL